MPGILGGVRPGDNARLKQCRASAVVASEHLRVALHITQEEPHMADRPKSGFGQRPKSKTPAERSVELSAASAKLKAEAAARREARAASEGKKP